LRNIFPKYPKIAVKIKEKSERRYLNNVRKVLLNERQKHILDVNHQNSYKQINIVDKPENQNDRTVYSKTFNKLDDKSSRSFMRTPNGSINGSGTVSIGAGKSSLPTTKPYNDQTDISNDLTSSGGNFFKSNFLSKTSSVNFS